MDKTKSYKKDLKSYIIGFVASSVLTISAFSIFLLSDLPQGTVFVILGILALTQFMVQLKYFFHFNSRTNTQEDIIILVFSSLIVLIMILGTVWILSSLHERMMVLH